MIDNNIKDSDFKILDIDKMMAAESNSKWKSKEHVKEEYSYLCKRNNNQPLSQNKLKIITGSDSLYKSIYKFFGSKKIIDDELDLTWDRTIKWTKEKCLLDALKYKTKSEWQKYSNGAKKSAVRNGWYEE
ncbi:MAG: hypothetical protein JSV49_03050, partial [Thermoplasmata archaeon]